MGRYFRIFFTPLSVLVSVLLVTVLIFIMDSICIPRNPSSIPQHVKTSLLNFSDFNYIINNEVCGTIIRPEKVLAVMIVTSHAGNVNVRQAHRSAIPKTTLLSLGIRRVFLLAVARENFHSEPYRTISQEAIDEENSMHEDLIQGNFNEAYRNLTYKHVMGLKWASTFCSTAQYIIKMDDDIILDVYKLLKLIKKETDALKPFILGYILRGVKPARKSTNKWFVTEMEYPKSYYPPFLSGWMYVTTPAVAAGVVNYTEKSSNYAPQNKNLYKSFFWIDDVFVTGIIAHEIKIQLIDFSKYFAVHPQYFQCCLEAAVIERSRKNDKEPIPYSCEFVVGPSGGDMKLLLQVLKEAEICWRAKEHCKIFSNRTQLAKKCIVGHSEAFDLIGRPLGKGHAILKAIKL